MIDFPIYQNIHELELTQLSYKYFLTFSRERERDKDILRCNCVYSRGLKQNPNLFSNQYLYRVFFFFIRILIQSYICLMAQIWCHIIVTLLSILFNPVCFALGIYFSFVLNFYPLCLFYCFADFVSSLPRISLGIELNLLNFIK